MTLKRILVHVNVSKHCAPRLAVAARLAQSFEARLAGIFTSAAGDVPYFMMQEVASRTEPTMRGWWQQTRDRLRADFEACTAATGVAADWIELGHDVEAGLARLARTADLTVVGQVDADELLPRPEYAIPERIALDAGGPALLVPTQGTIASVGQRVLVAWDGSAPAARALKDAMPFLARAGHVTILTIEAGKPGAADGETTGAAAIDFLSRHGVGASLRIAPGEDAAVGDVILAEAGTAAADLVVMGAYGHPRAREFILGGATRTMLKRMTVPVLMAH
ncbi:universal stress protein [Reyranella sp.]|uniref:universal stress protein n=1 Tax=Reyranella sp. TaxID=1929291 RepID=UPI003BADA51A